MSNTTRVEEAAGGREEHDSLSVLVTGGAGYVGSIIVEMLLDGGHKVVVLDNLIKGHRGGVDPRAAFVEGDIDDLQLVESTLRAHKVDAVMHFAAHSSVGESMENALKYFSNNVSAGLTLVEAMIRAGTRLIVFSSSAAAYGEPQSIPMRESDHAAPINPYGETKLMFERMLRWIDEVHGVRFVSLRYFNAAGASEKYGEVHDPESHLVPIVLQVALGQRPFAQIFGDDYPTPDGTAVRDYIHVSDLAHAHILALNWLNEGGESQVFNLGNGAGFSVKEVIEAARRVTGHDIPAQVVPRRAGDPPVLVASSEAITNKLGWQPQYRRLDDIIASAWEWHSRHPLGYEE